MKYVAKVLNDRKESFEFKIRGDELKIKLLKRQIKELESSIAYSEQIINEIDNSLDLIKVVTK